MAGDIDQRPNGAGAFGLVGLSAEQPRAQAEQDTAAHPDQFGRQDRPWKRFEQRQPAIFELGQFRAGNATRNEMVR